MLDILNHLFFLTYDGRHCICPKNEGAKRVLDMGTGTGMWAMDFGTAFSPKRDVQISNGSEADAHPEAEIGISYTGLYSLLTLARERWSRDVRF